MTIINLADYANRNTYEGDYVGNLAAEMETPRILSQGKFNPGLTPVNQPSMHVHEINLPPPGSQKAPIPVPRKTATIPAQRLNPSTPTTMSVRARMDQWHGQTPTLVYPWTGSHIQAHDGGGGPQMAFPASGIRKATAAAEEMAEPGWRTVSNYKGFLVQEYRSHLQRPLYRGIWGQEATPPRANPQDTHQDIDKTASAPRTFFTRNLPGARGVPDAMRSAVNTGAQEAWNCLGQKLARIRQEWGKTGHVETYHGVRIFRGKRNIQTPDGKKITVPFYYTKQKLKGVGNGPAPLEGYLAADQMNNDLAMVDGQAETETLDDMKALIDTHPLKEGETIAKDEGPGPAAGTITVQALPGEAGTSPEMTVMSDPKNRTKFVGAGLAAAALAYFFMG